MRTNHHIILFALLLSVIACEKAVVESTRESELRANLTEGINEWAQPKCIELSVREQATTSLVNGFTFDFFGQIRLEKADKNLVLSPLSAAVTLGLTASGASGNTAEQIIQVLGLEGLSAESVGPYFSKLTEGFEKADPYIEIHLANSLWADKNLPIKESFLTSAKANFDAEFASTDFSNPESIRIINDWVSQKTDGMIPAVLDEGIPGCKLAMVNALSFNGLWRYTFPATENASFHGVSGNQEGVNLMHMICDLNYANVDGYEYIALPYGTGAFSMYLILPPEKITFSQATLSLNQWVKAKSALELYEVDIQIPSFTDNASVELKEPLQGLGIIDAFSPVANFSPITSIPVYVGKALQKTHLEINEKGTSAAASTIEEFICSSPGPSSLDGTEIQQLPKCSITADRPFFYMVVEESTGAILFIGQKTSF